MRGLAIFFGIALLAAFGIGATELSLAVGQPQPAHRTVTKTQPAHTPSPTATPSPSASPSATPGPSATPVPNLPTAVTNGFVHMRAGTSTGTAIVANLNGGSVVYLTGKAIGLWQPVLYQGLNGYVYTPYLNY